MITEKQINPLAAKKVNHECVIKYFSLREKHGLGEVKTAYLEMARTLIQEYYSLVASGSTNYYRGAKLLAKASYAVRQANKVQYAIERNKL